MRIRIQTVSINGPLRLIFAALIGLGSASRADAETPSPPPALAPSAPSSTATIAAGATPPATPTPIASVAILPPVSAPIRDANVKPASATSYVPPQQPMLGEISNGYPSSDTQDAPGARDYSSSSAGSLTRLPAYYFEPSYYNTPWVGARPFADYAPPGYEEERRSTGCAGQSSIRSDPAAASTSAGRYK